MTVRPAVITTDDQLASLMRGRRLALGLSQEDVTDRAGFPDGYCAKLEAPSRKYGRRVIWGLSDFAAYWLQSLGLALVIMDRAQAEALIAASTAPAIDELQHRPYPNRDAKRTPVKRTRLRIGYTFTEAA